ncbi:hypothetical protein BDV12DRAFT_194382 [Aspergillus spectabilis]
MANQHTQIPNLDKLTNIESWTLASTARDYDHDTFGDFSEAPLYQQSIFSPPFSQGLAKAGTLFFNNFSSSALSQFTPCNVKPPSSVTVSDSTLEIYFSETDFDGTRDDKGAEICVFQPDASTNVPQMPKQGWQGFSLYVPSTDFPTDKSTIIVQQFCPGGCSSWCAAVQIKDNSVNIEHRLCCGGGTEETAVADFERDTWRDVVVHEGFERGEWGF